MLDEANHPANVSIASDVYQVGELLYFIYQGGARFSSESTPEGDYVVHFNRDVPDAIREIITRATHPNIKNQRYATMRNLREALTAYRQPMERHRNEITQNVQARLVENSSQQLLQTLDAELDAALEHDPGFPLARRLRTDIRNRLKHLAVQADFEYLSGNGKLDTRHSPH
jgi:hypothetical protein